MQTGSTVECIEHKPGWARHGAHPVKGCLYTVEDVIPSPHYPDVLYISLIEIETGGAFISGKWYPKNAYPIECFRQLLPPLSIKLSDLLREEITA